MMTPPGVSPGPEEGPVGQGCDGHRGQVTAAWGTPVSSSLGEESPIGSCRWIPTFYFKNTDHRPNPPRHSPRLPL